MHLDMQKCRCLCTMLCPLQNKNMKAKGPRSVCVLVHKNQTIILNGTQRKQAKTKTTNYKNDLFKFDCSYLVYLYIVAGKSLCTCILCRFLVSFFARLDRIIGHQFLTSQFHVIVTFTTKLSHLPVHNGQRNTNH